MDKLADEIASFMDVDDENESVETITRPKSNIATQSKEKPRRRPAPWTGGIPGTYATTLPASVGSPCHRSGESSDFAVYRNAYLWMQGKRAEYGKQARFLSARVLLSAPVLLH